MYFQTLHLVLDCGYDEFVKIVKNATGTDLSAECHRDADATYFLIPYEGTEVCYIWMEKFDKSTVVVAQLIHELYHHAVYALKNVDVKSEEATAYYLQYLVSQALTNLA